MKALHKLPDPLSWDAGAFCDNIGIALYAVERGQLKPGERVVVIGPGAFGGLAVQVARAMGAARVILVGTRAERVERLQRLADAVVVGRDEDAVLKTRLALGGDGGADLVIEFAGTPEAARQAIQLARRVGESCWPAPPGQAAS